MNIKTTLFIVILLVFAVFVSGCVNATDENTSPKGNITKDLEDDPEKVTVYFFWGEGCPHCVEEKPFLEDLEQKYPDLEVKMFETWNNPDNAELFQEVAKAYGTNARGVPTTFIGEEYWVGYNDSIGEEIEGKIKYCLENECINPSDKLN